MASTCLAGMHLLPLFHVNLFLWRAERNQSVGNRHEKSPRAVEPGGRRGPVRGLDEVPRAGTTTQ